MHRATGNTLIEIVVIISVLILMMAFLLPLFTRPHHGHSREMQNSTQVRGIHAGLVLYAQGNNSYYPGLMRDGVTIDPAVGLTVEGRIQKLIDDNYFTVEYARSPSEEQKGVTSYALLQVNTDAAYASGDKATKTGRNLEWKDTTNTEAVIISDRAVNNGTNFSHIKSIHMPKVKSGISDWRGSVGWNDNHVTFESSFSLTTKYVNPLPALDHLFINATGDAHTGSDAFMVYSGTSQL